MRRAFVLLIALLSLVFQGLGAVVSAWICEGRTCSTNAAACCCASPSRDVTCQVKRAVAKSCAGKCNCKLSVVSARVASHLQPSQKAPVPAPAPCDLPVLLPPTFALPVAAELTYSPILPNPPPNFEKPPLLEGAPLRAPPALFV